MASYVRGRCLLGKLMKERGLTNEELSRMTNYDKAKKIGYSPRMISHFKNGTKPMGHDAEYTIAKALGVFMEDLHEWIRVG